MATFLAPSRKQRTAPTCCQQEQSSTAISERVELAKLCNSPDWSKAIRVLDSFLAQSCAIQDICNRAFCYGRLELHKHVIKDYDKALQLDPTFLQAYILKDNAFSALGRKEDAIAVWEQGYVHEVTQWSSSGSESKRQGKF